MAGRGFVLPALLLSCSLALLLSVNRVEAECFAWPLSSVQHAQGPQTLFARMFMALCAPWSYASATCVHNGSMIHDRRLTWSASEGHGLEAPGAAHRLLCTTLPTLPTSVPETVGETLRTWPDTPQLSHRLDTSPSHHRPACSLHPFSSPFRGCALSTSSPNLPLSIA